MDVLIPTKITDAILISATAPENDYPPYASGTTYGVGDRVISTTTHRIYESLRASNIGKDPTLISNQSGNAPWWLDVGPTNRWACVDGVVSTATVFPGDQVLVFRPGFFSGLALFGLAGAHLSVVAKQTPGGSVYFDYSAPLDVSYPGDWDQYFFGQFKAQTDYVVTNLPPFYAAEVTITITGSKTAIGVVAIGDSRNLGRALKGAEAKRQSNSFIKTDDFGTTTIKRRRSAKDFSLQALVPLDQANVVADTLEEVLDVPCVYIATDRPQYSPLRSYGLGSGRLKYDLNDYCTLSLEVQGMI